MCPKELQPMKLTVANIHSLTPPARKDGKPGDKIFFDSELAGFGLRVRDGGSKTWLVQYAVAGKTRRLVLGPTSLLDPSKARTAAKDILAKVRLGQDPVAEKAEKRARTGETFEACLKIYLERRRNEGRLRASSYREIERHLIRNLKALHGLQINNVDRRDIAIELGRMTTEGGAIQANRTRASLVKFLSWCAGEGYIDANPAQFTNKNPEVARDRVLVDDELRKIWAVLPQSDFGDIVRLLMLTGARANEIARLAWSEIDLERGVIAIPGSRTKNRRTHFIPITATVRAILDARPHRDGRDLVFGRGQGGFSGWSNRKQELDKAVGLAPWVIHDIRRSVATGMADIGIVPFVIEAVLNHQSGAKAGVAGRYNRSGYEAEKASALVRWDEHLMGVVGVREVKITPMQRA
jgi:integrase